ncbi:MAG: phosphorylase [Candidatus Pelagibacter sp. TMED239]|nr:MAG: phosphorylase [Candidatus Pelagibacter sp. TMED239]
MKSSEIITNNDGSIYHLCLKPNQVSKDIILVGDPFRVDIISKYLQDVEFNIQNREFKSVTGYFNKKRVSVISTGIGGSNIDIVINELDALFNYDFTNKYFKNTHESINFIRIGTSGSISKDIPIDSWLISEYAIDINSQLSFYDLNNYTSKNIEVISLNNKNLYCFKASTTLFEKFYSDNLYKGLTASCNGFYAFQGRETRIPLESTIDIDDMKSIELKKYKVTNLEMETAIIYGLSDFLGHNAISLNAILANRINDLYSENPSKIIESLILFVLNKI